MLVLPVNSEPVQGGPVTPGTNYTHVQAAAASEWTIIHNLGRRPAIVLYDTMGVVFAADIYHASNDVAGVRLNTPMSGFAYCT